MPKIIEVEQKFSFTDYNQLLKEIYNNDFKKLNKKTENDEYFTDINSIYIENRACLRIRNINNEHLELTFKDKSKELTNNYAKIRNNINLEISDYDSIASLLHSLEYFSYTIVNKQRTTYTKIENDLEYNIIIDEVENIGNFLEFKLLYYNTDKDIEYLRSKLTKLLEDFKTLNLNNANLTYQELAANKTYISIHPQDKLEAILFDLDGTLINSEQKFFESFRYVILSKYNYNITYKEYEENELKQNANLIIELKNKGIIDEKELSEDIMNEVYSEYEKKFIELLEENEVVLIFELLKQLKNKGLRLALVSTSRRKFIDILLKKLNIKDLFEVIISREDVKNLKPAPDAYNKALSLLDISSNNCIAIEDSERGIKAAKEATIKTIQANDFIKDKTNNNEISEKLSRILFAIINFVEK